MSEELQSPLFVGRHEEMASLVTLLDRAGRGEPGFAIIAGEAGVGKTRLVDELSARARAVNRRLLDTERVGRGCVLASPAFERIARPTLTEDGRRAPALRFGDPRVQALAAPYAPACSPSPASPTRACAP